MGKFRDYIVESIITSASVISFLKENNITNFDANILKLNNNVYIELSGQISKTGSAFNNLYDLLANKYGKRKVEFKGWNKNKPEIAEFTIKI